MDFVTIFYNNNIDIKLLEIQARSFKYVNDNNICNQIILFFNSNNENEDNIFSDYFYNNLLNLYPLKFKECIKFYTKKHFNLECKNNWTSQQLLKLVICEKVKSEYYLVLDTKIHFIKHITLNDFFTPKPILFFNLKTHLNTKFIGSLKLFNNEEKINNYINSNIYEVSTICPFIFKTFYVKQLISEFSNFNLFFLLNNNITEFFLYSSYLIKINKLNDYFITNDNKISYIFFNNTINITTQKIIGIHHNFILDDKNIEEKAKILKLYENDENQKYIYELFSIKNTTYFLD